MVHSHVRAELRLNVGDGSGASVAVTLVAPQHPPERATIMFAFPGGGYNRRYFDLQHPALGGDTQAEWHARRGVVFIACDPYGSGDSTSLDPSQCSLAITAAVFHRLVTAAVAQLRAGTLAPGLAPTEASLLVGIGHSLGGMQLIAQQGGHATFDAIGVLGFSAVQTVVPTQQGFLAPHSASDTDEHTLEQAWSGPFADDLAHLRFAYHWADVAPALVAEDMSAGFPVRRPSALPSWITRTFPPFAKICMQAGIIAREAAAVAVPVFVATGERDVLRDLRQEAAAYRQSRDITLFEIPRCAHMHNFSPAREVVWSRLQRWLDGLPAR